MTDQRLKSLAERIERLMDERDGIQGDIRDIYAEAKSAGYVPKVLRKAITRKRMDPDKRSEEDTILDLYEGALTPTMRKAVAMAAKGASAREIETETGIDQATVARSVSLNKKSETPNPEDGDDGITDAALRADAPLGIPQIAGVIPPSVKPDSESREGSGTHSDEAPATPPVGAVASESERVAPPYPDDDDLTIPSYLRGPAPENRRMRT